MPFGSVPAVMAHLSLKLSRTPSGITQGHQPMSRPASFGNRTQYVARRGKPAEWLNLDGVHAAPVGRMKDETAARFNRPTVHHRTIRRDAGIDVEFLQYLVKAHAVPNVSYAYT